MFGAHPLSWLFIIPIGIIWKTHLSTAELRVVCYYTNWSVYRPGTAKFSPQNINPYLCTHLIYAFGGFTKESTFKPFDKYQDIEKGGYSKFTGLKTYNKELKTLMAVGGWNEGSSRFSSMAANSDKRREFVKNSVKFLRQNHFDGLDLDWEYPSFRDGGKPQDKENYALLVQELREEYDREAEKTGRPRLLLTMAVPAGDEYTNKGYDIPKLSKYLDWMNILSYDYHSSFEPSLNHHSPLYSLEEESEYNYDSDLNINHTIHHYFKVGADRDKLVLGIPTYGRSYTLFNPDATNIGDAADGPGEMGEATRENGYLAYYEICERIKSDSSWIVKQPNEKAMGPYAHKENQWVGYDDENIVRKKAEFVAEHKLGGIMFWSIDNDDFRGTCHGRPYPLIEAAKEALIRATGSINENTIPEKEEKSSPFRNRNRKPSPTKTDEEDAPKPSKRLRPRPKTTTEEALEPTEAPKKRIKVPSKRKLTTSTTETTPTISSTTPRWQTPEPPTTPNADGGEFKCEEEGFFAHPRDCKKYYWCLSGASETGMIAHQFTCPSGLHFNKLADSCDYTQNVLCSKKAKATTAATTSTSSSTPASTTTVTTSRTTPKTSTNRPTTTTVALEEEYEDEYEDDDIATTKNSEEDPKVIKELIDLIKKAGGIEELEKQLKLNENGGTSISLSGSTTPSAFNKSLYERILANRAKLSATEKNSFSRNSRGPQYEKSGDVSETNTGSKRSRPQYTAISRHRSTTEEQPDEPLEENVADDYKPTKPDYKIITRSRSSTSDAQSGIASSTTTSRLKAIAEAEVSKQAPLEYVTLRRSRPTTTELPPTLPKISSTTETVTIADQAIANELPNNDADKSTDSPTETNKVEATTPTSSTTTTQKVSEPISHRNLLRSRFSSSNKFASFSTASTQRSSTITERTENLPKRTGSRYVHDDATEHTNYEDISSYERKFRPDMSSGFSDLSSLTSADLSSARKNNNVSRRPHIRRVSTTTEEEQQAGSDTIPEVRKQFPNRRITTGSTTLSTSTAKPRVTSRPYSIQHKPLESTPEVTTEKVVSPSRRMRKIVRRYRTTTTTENNQIAAKTEDENTSIEEGENIKLSESKIRLNSLSNDGNAKGEPLGKDTYTKDYNDEFLDTNPTQRTRKVEKLKNEKLNTDTHTKNSVSTESIPVKRTRKINDNDVIFTEPSPTQRPRKVLRKLITTTTESTAITSARTRKIIRRLRPSTSTDEVLPNKPGRQSLEIYNPPLIQKRRKVVDKQTNHEEITTENQKGLKEQDVGYTNRDGSITYLGNRRNVPNGNTNQDYITTPINIVNKKRVRILDDRDTTLGDITMPTSTEYPKRGNTNQIKSTTHLSEDSQKRRKVHIITNQDYFTTPISIVNKKSGGIQDDRDTTLDEITIPISTEYPKRRNATEIKSTTHLNEDSQQRRKVQDNITNRDYFTTPISIENEDTFSDDTATSVTTDHIRRRNTNPVESTTRLDKSRDYVTTNNQKTSKAQENITENQTSYTVQYVGNTNHDDITTQSATHYTEYPTLTKIFRTDTTTINRVQDTYSTLPQSSETSNDINSTDLASTLAVFASIALESNREEVSSNATTAQVVFSEQSKDAVMPTTIESYNNDNIVQNSTSPSTVLFLIVASNTDTSTDVTAPEEVTQKASTAYQKTKLRPLFRHYTSEATPISVSQSQSPRFNKHKTTGTTKDVTEDVTLAEIELGNRFAYSTNTDAERPRFRPHTTTTEIPSSKRSSRRYSGISRTTPTHANTLEIEAKHSRNKLFSNRNRKINTPHYEASTTTEAVTLRHIFAETSPTPPPQTPKSPKDKKVERLIEVNRIVEVSLKENKIQKHQQTLHNEFTLVPSLDRIGAINRITEIKVIDPEIEQDVAQHLDSMQFEESNVKSFTPKPNFNAETSTIALQALFSKNADELLETQNANFVNVRVLKQDTDRSKTYRMNEEAPFVPIRVLRPDEDGSRARVVEVAPHFGPNIKIAPISFSFSQKYVK